MLSRRSALLSGTAARAILVAAAVTLVAASGASAFAQPASSLVGANGSNGGDAIIGTVGVGGAGGQAGDGSFTSGAGGTGGYRNLGGAGSGPEGGSTGTTIGGTGSGGGPDSGGGGASADSASGGYGGGGGGGGGRGATVTTTLNNSGTITGGSGGGGGNGASFGTWAGGGGGGGGGNGVVLTGTAITNSGTVTGGNGGNGGIGAGSNYEPSYDDGTGGTGGVGLLVQTTTGATITNSGTIAGGVGGTGFGPQGLGGVGIRGENLTVINSGTIAGGGGGNAITFTGGANVLELRKGYSFTGIIAGDGTSDTLRLGGASNTSFDLATLGDSAQFQDFERFEKTGASTWTVTGTSDFAGPTAVQSGQMAINGSLANSIVTVANGAILSGGGTIGGLVVRNGASVRPGNSIGTLTVNGDVSFASGSTYQVEANAGGQSDHIAATGTATLSGGTVQVLAENGVYLPSTTYTILTANGGVTDTFDTVTSNFAFLAPSLGYDANHVFLTLERKTVPTEPPPLAFNSVAVTRNQYNLAGAAEALGAGSSVFDAVIDQSVAGARQAFDALSGEVHASAVTSAYGDARQIRNAVLGRLRQPVGSPATVAAAFAADLPGVAPLPVPVPVPTLDPRRFALWGAAFGSWGKVDSNGNAAGMDASTGGFAIGADATLDQTYRIGVAGGFTRTTFDIDGRLSSGSNESVFGALYGSGTWGGLNLRLGTSYAVHDIDTSRRVVFPGFSDDLRASYDGWTAQAFGELGYRFDAGVAVLEPFVGASILRLHTDSFGETGEAAALIGNARDYDLGTTTVGLRAEARLSAEVPLMVRGLVGWRHAYGDVEPAALLAFSNGTAAFAVSGVPVDRDALVAEAGLDWQATQDISLGVSYQGQIGQRAQDHGLKGNFTWKF